MSEHNPASSHSTVIEKTLEHRFLADLCSYLWTRGVHDFAVSQSEVDHYGYDVIVEVGDVVRHIQLKLAHLHAKRSRVSVNMRLSRKPSGCVVWMFYQPENLMIDHYRWFGGLPGEPLPYLGERVTRHTKADSAGFKAERLSHRDLPKAAFTIVGSIAELSDKLFGDIGEEVALPIADVPS